MGRPIPATTSARSARGDWRRTEQSTKGMAAANVVVDVIISSPLLRARQTAEIVHQGLERRRRYRVFADALARGDLSGIVAFGSVPTRAARA